jgi:hypothetical protein
MYLIGIQNKKFVGFFVWGFCLFYSSNKCICNINSIQISRPRHHIKSKLLRIIIRGNIISNKKVVSLLQKKVFEMIFNKPRMIAHNVG